MTELVRMAYHEAGHVLVARQMGRRVESVSVSLNGGTTRGDPLPPDASPAEIEQSLVVVFAGRFAERHAPPELFVPTAWSDPYFTPGEAEAEHLAATNGEAERPTDDDVVAHYADRVGAEAVERAQALAEELVWRADGLGDLERLANELMRRNHLGGAEVEQLLEKERR